MVLNPKWNMLLLSCLFSVICLAQNGKEREHRIKKSQFPSEGIHFIKLKLSAAKKIRYYKEVDSSKTIYRARFKMDKLNYGISFDTKGQPQDIKLLIREIDMPEAVFQNIQSHLQTEFKKFSIQKIHQQYLFNTSENLEVSLKNALQNLILPSIKYHLVVAGKNKRQSIQYEIQYNSEGKFLVKRQSLPANYDHVLY